MIYYIFLKDDDQDVDSITANNHLGEVSFDRFITDEGYNLFSYIVNKKPEMLDTITIRDSNSGFLTPEQFLDKISKLKVIR